MRAEEANNERSSNEEGAVGAQALAQGGEAGILPGRYLYGVAKGSQQIRLGPIGLEGNDVYTIPYHDIVAIVHDCPDKPYESADGEVVKSWVRSHQSVLDVAKKRFGTVVPMSFDTILQSKGSPASPGQAVEGWLKKMYEWLQALIGRLEGKDEYVVQVFYEPSVAIHQVSEKSDEVKRMKEEMVAKGPGAAYLYKQKLEQTLRDETGRLADKWFKDFLERVSSHADDISVDRTRKQNQGKVMLLNLSCLVASDRVAGLGEELERIESEEGFPVHFSGPWPPYSFVAKPIVWTKGEGDATYPG